MRPRTIKQSRGSSAVRELLALPYSRVLMPADDGGYWAEILEFPDCSVHAPTPSEAYSRLERAAREWLADWLSQGKAVPPPLVSNKTSGRFALRLPRSLYLRASRAAARESVSLNQYIANAVAERVGASTATAALLGLVDASEAHTRPARPRAN